MQLHTFLTSALEGGEWPASGAGRFIYWIVGWLGSRTDLDAVLKGKIISLPCRKTNPIRPARSLVTIMTELPRLPPGTGLTLIIRR
jgi:hypothetical protein